MNNMKVEFEALPENEGFARVAVAAFLTLNPTLEEIEDVKTAVSEAVTNAVIHGYKEQGGTIEISCVLEKGSFENGNHRSGLRDRKMWNRRWSRCSRADLERSGMGFSFMEAFMDCLEVESTVGKGTRVIMEKKLGNAPWVSDPDQRRG